LIGAGVAGLGAYIYIDRVTPAAKMVKLKETSPLDPSKFVDFELKRVEPYNHNTAK
jgi:cytochrome-b5 reductase